MKIRHVARFTSLLALLSTFGSVLGVGERASACSPLEPDPGYLGLGAHEPTDGATGVALDSAIAIDLLYMPSGGETQLSVNLTNEASGELVEGELLEMYWGRTIVAFWPTQDLAPNTTYRMTAVATSSIARPSDAEGVEELDVSFTTGDALLPALEQRGELQVEFEDYEREQYTDCDGLCTCDPTGTVIDTRAVLRLPGARGGQGDRGYSVMVSAVDDEGATMNTNLAIVFDEPGTELELGALRGDHAYSPCFEVSISDVAGNALADQVLCVSDEIPALAELAPDSDAGTSAEAGTDSPLEADAGPGAADESDAGNVPSDDDDDDDSNSDDDDDDSNSDDDDDDDDSNSDDDDDSNSDDDDDSNSDDDDDSNSDDDSSDDPHFGEDRPDDTTDVKPAGRDGCQVSALGAPSSAAGLVATLFAFGLFASRRRRARV